MIRILLADDHAVVRAGLRALLAKEAGFEVVAEACDGREALALSLSLGPDVVVMDVSMSGLNGIEATRQIVAARRGMKVLCLSMHAEEQFVGAALQAGASGYLLKDCSPTELVQGIRVVAAGETYLAPAIASTVVRAFTANRPLSTGSALSLLTGREREVLQLIAEGRDTKRIAEILGVSAKTVASHRERIQHKLDLDGVAALTRYALSNGIVAPSSDRHG